MQFASWRLFPHFGSCTLHSSALFVRSLPISVSLWSGISPGLRSCCLKVESTVGVLSEEKDAGHSLCLCPGCPPVVLWSRSRTLYPPFVLLDSWCPCYPRAVLASQVSSLCSPNSLCRVLSMIKPCRGVGRVPWAFLLRLVRALCRPCPGLFVSLVRVICPFITALSEPCPLPGHAAFPFSTALSGYVFVLLCMQQRYSAWNLTHAVLQQLEAIGIEYNYQRYHQRNSMS